MDFSGHIKQIDLALLDTGLSCFRLVSDAQVQDIKNSIINLGLLHPVLVSHISGSYQIIDGFKRYYALKDLSCERITCRVIEANQSESKALLICSNRKNSHTVDYEEGIIVYTNPLLEHMYGYATEELKGQSISILYPKMDAGGDGFHSHIWPKLQTEGKWQGEMATLNKGGSQVGVTVRYSQCTHENQNYWIGFHENILELENVKLGSEHIPIKKLL